MLYCPYRWPPWIFPHERGAGNRAGSFSRRRTRPGCRWTSWPAPSPARARSSTSMFPGQRWRSRTACSRSRAPRGRRWPISTGETPPPRRCAPSWRRWHSARKRCRPTARSSAAGAWRIPWPRSANWRAPRPSRRTRAPSSPPASASSASRASWSNPPWKPRRRCAWAMPAWKCATWMAHGARWSAPWTWPARRAIRTPSTRRGRAWGTPSLLWDT